MSCVHGLCCGAAASVLVLVPFGREFNAVNVSFCFSKPLLTDVFSTCFSVGNEENIKGMNFVLTVRLIRRGGVPAGDTLHVLEATEFGLPVISVEVKKKKVIFIDLQTWLTVQLFPYQ